jgi:hypothetical protein
MKRTQRLLMLAVLNIVWGSFWVPSANAGVITGGTWGALEPDAFWNNASWDGPGLNAGQLLTSWGWPVEYLSDDGNPVAFAFEQDTSFREITSVTDWLDNRGIWELADGSIKFSTHGYTYNSVTSAQHFALFRYVASTYIVYFLGVEDIPWNLPSDHDYNDYIGYTIEYLPPPPPPTPTPEPGTLALLLSGGGLALLRKRRS